MAYPIDQRSTNLLLQVFSPEDWQIIAPLLTRVPLLHRQTLETPGKTIRDVYFPESGLASIVASTPSGRQNEVGLVGVDGMTGGFVVMGDAETPFECVAQMAGFALRISVEDLQATVAGRPNVKRILMGFARALVIQTAFTALTNDQSHIDQRLARWLLMVHDRVRGDTFAITHDYLAVMLGVRRTSVTEALHVLEGNRLIVSTRNKVVVTDRSGLLNFASGSYGPSEREYKRIVGVALAKSL